MYVRLAFAVAAYLESEILIVDEVLAVGDAEFQKKCIDKMNNVSKAEGRTILFVSHNMGAIKKLCKTGILLQNGKLSEASSINTVLDQYFIANNSYSNGEESGFLNYNDGDLGRDECFLDSVSISQNNYITSIVDSGKDIYITVNYTIKSPLNDFSIGLNITNSEGDIVLHSSDVFVFGHDGICPRETGQYSSVCIIKANTLNEGSYSLSISADIPNTKEFFILQSFLKFKVENTSLGASKYSSSMWKGSLNPEIVNWQLKRQ
jgi:lipopolysaccharide transport system ATP-binding protein